MSMYKATACASLQVSTNNTIILYQYLEHTVVQVYMRDVFMFYGVEYTGVDALNTSFPHIPVTNSVSGRCILNMDHYCPWMCNCVGYGNYRYFVLFLLYMSLGSLNVVCYTLSDMVQMTPEERYVHL